jgi:hypothetical protein
MIKSPGILHASLDTIYGEIIQLAGSVGECKSSIDHVEDVMNRSHYDLKECLVAIDKRLVKIEDQTREERRKFGYITQFFQLSLPNLFKWTCLLIIIGIFIGSGTKITFPRFVSRLEHYVMP